MKCSMIIGALLFGMSSIIPTIADAAQPKRVRVTPAAYQYQNKWEAQLRAGSPTQCAHPGSRQVAQIQREKGLCK
jgi:hypothetical protein